MLYTLTFVVFFFLIGSLHALREQHVVVLRWPTGYFFLTRGEDGRYTLFHGARFPLVVTAHTMVSLAHSAQALVRRLRGWSPHRQVALGVRR